MHSQPAPSCSQGHDLECAALEITKSVYLDLHNAKLYRERANIFAELFDLRSAAANVRRAIDLREGTNSKGNKSHLASLADALGSLLLERDISRRRFAHIPLLGTRKHARGGVLARDQDIVTAKSYFDEAIALDSLVPKFRVHRAIAALHTHGWRAALAGIEHCLLLTEPNAEVHVLRAKLLWKLRMPTLREAFKTAFRLSPTHPEVVLFESIQHKKAKNQYQSASNCLLASNYSDAVQLLTKALELNHGGPKLLTMRASAYRRLGAFELSQKDIVRRRFSNDG